MLLKYSYICSSHTRRTTAGTCDLSLLPAASSGCYTVLGFRSFGAVENPEPHVNKQFATSHRELTLHSIRHNYFGGTVGLSSVLPPRLFLPPAKAATLLSRNVFSQQRTSCILVARLLQFASRYWVTPTMLLLYLFPVWA